MSSPIPPSASRWRPKAAATPGRSTAARTSSRRGRTIRSAIARAKSFYLRDEDTGDLWCPTALPIRDDSRHLCRAAWLGLQPVRACRARHRSRTAAVRAARRSDQDLAPDAAQHIGPHPASLGDRLRRMGARSVARRLRAVRDDRDRSRHRRDVRAQSMERRLRIARRLRRSCRAADRLDRRPAGVHRPQRDTAKARRRWPARRRSPTPWAPVSIPCGALRTTIVLPPNGRIEIVFFLGEAASAQDARAL